MRALVELAVRRRVSVLMVALAVIAFGAVGLSRLTLSLLPDISYPSITVETDFPDAAPGEVENLVTKPVEEAVGVLRGLRELHSISRAGRSEVTLDFDWKTDMDALALEVREKLDRLMLPDDAEQPIVLRYDPALDPVVRLALGPAPGQAPPDLTLLRRIAEKKVKETLETIPGIASARVKGGDEEEIQIGLDQGKLARLGIPPEAVAAVVATSNINRPGGSLDAKNSRYLIRTLNEYDSLAEIADLAINEAGGPPVRLGDIASVVWGRKERKQIVRLDGAECVEIALYKEGDANAVSVARAVRERLPWLERELPAGMAVTVLFDQARFIERSILEVRSALLLGGLLAVLVVLGFLRDLNPTLIIATSIPLSVVACFILMYRLDVSLNIMSLGGLALGIGMLVDSSIVVLEAIDRRRQEGLSRRAAAIAGTAEVGGAVIASTLTTVAVFVPIIFVEGMAGQLFRDQALTVTFSLLASLLVSVSLIPMLSSLGKQSAPRAHGASEGGLARAYERVLKGALRFRFVTLGVAVAAFAGALALVPSIGSELIPALTEGEFHFEVALPEGTPLAATDRVVAGMEARTRSTDGVARTFSSVGSRLVSGGATRSDGENLAQVNVVLADRSDDAAEARTAELLRREFDRIPGVSLELARPSFFSLKTPVELVFYGDDLSQLRDYVAALRPRIADVAGIENLRSSIEAGNPELAVVFDRDLLARHDLTIRDASRTLHDRVQGALVSRFKVEDRQIDIRMRNRLDDRATVGDVENLVVARRDGVPLTLSYLASIEPVRGPAEIHRIEQSRAAILAGDLTGRRLGATVADVVAAVAAFPPPEGITFEMAGQSKEMGDSFASLRFAFLLAIFLVYLVMAGTFENLIHPFIILLTIPLALVGVVLGLYLSGHPFSVISIIGTIFLAGVVVNNAIVLVDAINRARREGVDKLQAVLQAGRERLRPILMTTLTTILGLVPMAVGFGEGEELRAPMAIVVIAGLVVSTILTLIVVPVVYQMVPSTVASEREEEGLYELPAEGQGSPAS